MIDTPVKTLYVPGPFGEEYAGKRVQRREMVFTVQVGLEDEGPDYWASVDAAWRWAWDYEQECKMTVTTSDGERFIYLRLLEEPKSYGDKDPHLTGDEEVVMTVTATFPYWQEKPAVYEFTGSTNLDIANTGDIAVFPSWTLTAPGTWTLPDYSWGSDMYSRAEADATRTVTLPNLPSGAHCVVDADPRVQTLVCANSYPAQQHWKGKDLMYPIAAGAKGTVSVTGPSLPGRLTIPRWYSRPWSRPVAL